MIDMTILDEKVKRAIMEENNSLENCEHDFEISENRLVTCRKCHLTYLFPGKIIGLCGKSGSGKSTLANQIIKLTNNQAIHLDIDKVGHKVLLLPEVKIELINSFGQDIFTENIVDRKKLGEIVFASRKEMHKLSDITWKYMQKEIDNFLIQNKDKIVILDWLLLSISKYFAMCDLKILLDVPLEIRKQRVIKRDNLTEDAFALREQASIEFDPKAFDYVLIDTDKNQVRKLVKSL